MAEHVRAMLRFQRNGAVVFDYGNNIRAQAEHGGVDDAFDIPGFVPEYIRPLFCQRQGTVPMGGAVGRSGGHRSDRQPCARDVQRGRGAVPLDSSGARARGLPGSAGTNLLARIRRARTIRPGDQRSGAARRREGADRDWPRPPRCRLRRVAQPRDRGDA